MGPGQPVQTIVRQHVAWESFSQSRIVGGSALSARIITCSVSIMFVYICKIWRQPTLCTVNTGWQLVTVFYSVVSALGLYKNALDRGRKELENWIGKQSWVEAPIL